MPIIGMSRIKISTAMYCFFLLSLLTLLYIIINSPTKFIADERDFVPNIKLLKQYGWTLTFLNQIKGQSPGPLYQYIYLLVGYIIELTPRNMRLVNFLFLLCDLYLLSLLISYNLKKHHTLVALLLIAVPMMWGLSCTAGTEMPAFFFMFLSLLLLKKALIIDNNTSVILALIGGLCAGTAIIGRSPFLMLLPSACLLFLIPNKRMCILLFLLSSSAFPAIVFYTWNGLVPPDVQSIQSGIQIGYLMLAIIYFTIITLMIYPQFYTIQKVHYHISILLFGLLLIFNIFYFNIKWLPLRGLIGMLHIVPDSMSIMVEYIFPSLALATAYLSVISIVNYLIKIRRDVWNVFLFTTCLLIMLTTVKSSAHFASKYIMQAYPMFLICISPNITINKYLFLRIIVGTALGIVLITTAFQIHSHLY